MVIRIRRDELTFDKRLMSFFIGYIFLSSINLYIKIILGGIQGWEVFSKGFMGILLLFAIRPIVERSKNVIVVSEITLVFLFLLSLQFGYVPTDDLKEIAFNACVVYLPMGICIYSIKDVGYFMQVLYKWAWPTCIVLLLMFNGLIKQNEYEYLMSYGYVCLFVLLIVLDHLALKRKWYDLVLASLLIVMIVTSGSRGQIVCIISYIVLKVLFSVNISKGKRIAITTIGVAIVAILSEYYIQIATSFNRLLLGYGIHSRTIRMLLSQKIASDSGRFGIYSFYIEQIKEHPLIGWGIAGGWRSMDSYPHNIAIEYIVSFGVIVGSVLLLVLCIILIRGITVKSLSLQRLTHIFAAYFVSLMFSGSFITTPLFFSIVFSCLKRNKALKKSGGSIYE